jgi:hypothetical protein
MNISRDVSYQKTHLQGFRNYSKLLLLLFVGISLVLGANRLLAMANDTNGFYPIAIGDVLSISLIYIQM